MKDNLDSTQVLVPKIVTTIKEIADYFQVGWATVKSWERKGMPVRAKNKYDLNDISIWRMSWKKRLADTSTYPIVDVNNFKANRADVYATEQAEDIRLQKLIRSFHFTKDEIKAMKKSEARDIYDVLRKDQKDKFEQERLERGESTQNVALIVQAIRDAKKRQHSNSSNVEGQEGE